MPPGGTTKDETYFPFEGRAGGCPVANMARETRRTPPYTPLDRGDFQQPSMPPRAAPQSMKKLD